MVEGDEFSVNVNLAGVQLCSPSHGGSYPDVVNGQVVRGVSGSVLLQVWHNVGGGHLFGIVEVRRERDGSVASFDAPVAGHWVRFGGADIAGGGVTVKFKALTGSDYRPGSGLTQAQSRTRALIQFDASHAWRGAEAVLDVTKVRAPSVVDVEIDVDPSTDVAVPATSGRRAVHEETCRWNLSGDGCFDVDEGVSKAYRLRLRRRPAAGDVLTVTPFQAEMNGSADLVFSPSTVSFTDSDWNVWQTVTVTAPHDVDTRWGEFRVEHRFSSGFRDHDDPTARSFSRFHGRVVDDDRVEMVVKDSEGRVVGAGGLSDNLSLLAGSETFVTVELTHEPSDTHTVRASAKDFDGGTRPPVGLRHPSHPQFRADHANPSPALVADIRSYIAETRFGEAHVNRWKRVLETLGVEDYPGLEPLTLAEAFRNTGRRMAPVRELLTAQQRGGYPSNSLNYSATGVQFTRSNWSTPQKIVIRRWNGATDPRCLSLPAEETAVGACWKIGLSLVGNGLKQAQTLYLGMPAPGDPLQVNLDFDKDTVTEGNTARLWATLTAPNPTDQAIRISYGLHSTGTIGFNEYRFDPRGANIFIAPGDRRGFATLLARTDSVTEPGGETVVVFQGIHRGGVRTNHSDRATITVVDPPPSTSPQVLAAAPSLTVASDVGSVSEGGDIVFTVTADPVPQLDTTVNLFVSEEMGDGLDYVGRGEAFQVTIPAGQSSVGHRFTAYSDNTKLADGTIVARINTGDGYTLGDPHSVSIDLLDDDEAAADDEAAVPEVAVAAARDSVTEGDAAVFTVTATPAPAGGLPVTVTITADGAFGAVAGSRTVTVPAAGSVALSVATSDDSADEPDGSVTVTVNGGSGYTVSAAQGAGTVNVSDDDDAATGPALDAQLEADVRSYAAETRHGTLHVNRWKRVLEAFGLEDYAGLEPTTLDEARVHVDIGRSRWVPVLAHMAAMDAVSPQPPSARGNGQVDAQVLATARSKAAETHWGAKHVNRWKRVLEAFGDGDYPGIEPLTAAGAQVYANVWPAWDQVAAQLRLIEAAATTDPAPVIPPVVVVPPVVVPQVVAAPVPEVNIVSSAGGTEGATVSFTLTAAPAPAADLDVDLSVVTSGDFGYGPIPASVTIPTSGTATVTVTTSDDSTDEPDGSVTLTVDAGSGYTVGAHGSDSVDVTDDDDPVAPAVVAPDPVVSITAGPGVTEGGSAAFTVAAAPAPATALDVTVTVTHSGDYGAVTGSRTVTIPTSGSVSFTVATTDDSADEPDGSVTATVDAASVYTVSNTQRAATVNVSDNDIAPPASSVTVSVGDATGSEAGGVVEFTVTLSEASSEQVRVWFSTSNWRGLTGRAHMWLDYWTAQQTVAFAPGQTERTVPVWLVDDHRPEPDEHFTVTLTNPRGAAIGQGAATGTITDDD